jgi:hypothetical protein
MFRIVRSQEKLFEVAMDGDDPEPRCHPYFHPYKSVELPLIVWTEWTNLWTITDVVDEVDDSARTRRSTRARTRSSAWSSPSTCSSNTHSIVLHVDVAEWFLTMPRLER